VLPPEKGSINALLCASHAVLSLGGYLFLTPASLKKLTRSH